MNDTVAKQLVALNKAFYASFAQPFAETRADPQPGFARLLEHLPPDPLQVLDVGAGDGRFGRFLRSTGRTIHYTAVDITPGLLEHAHAVADDVLLCRDLSEAGSLAGLPTFSVVACLSTLQHIPSHENRVRLLREMGEHLKPDGRLLLGNWQFLDSARQRRKLRDWSLVNIDPLDVGPEDYLLSWNRGGNGLRYVAHLDPIMTQRLLDDAGLHLMASFRSDGREGDLNLYSIVSS